MERDDPEILTVRAAVEYRNLPAAIRTARARAGMEERNALGSTPLMTAVSTQQFRIAEALIDAGADIWAYNEFGATVGRFAEQSRVDPDSDEGQARARVLARLKASGYPLPTPDQPGVLAAVAEGRWPPRPAAGQ